MKGDFHVRFCERLAGEIPACLLDRKRGCILVRHRAGNIIICSRPSLCDTPACVKPPPRCMQFCGQRSGNLERRKIDKNQFGKCINNTILFYAWRF